MRLSGIFLICCSIALLPGAFAESSVITWGRNLLANGGRTNQPADLTNIVAVSCSGYPYLALRADGTAVAWGEAGGNNGPAFPNAVAIDAGYNHVMLMQHDGTLVARGYYGNTSNLMTAPVSSPPRLPNVNAFTCGGVHDAALLGDGTVVAWGLSSTQTNVPAGLVGVIAIDAGRLHTVALKNDGTVVAWGDNAYGQCDVPAGLTEVTAVAAGHFFNVALKSDGTLAGWGDNTFGQLNFPPDATNVVVVSAGRNHCLARRNDGTLIAWGDNQYGQASIPADLPDVLAFSAGSYNNIVLSGPPDPEIFPQSQTVHAGLRASFGVLAGGVGRIRYQWRHDGTEIPGATGVVLSLTNVQPAHAGIYTVEVMDDTGSVISSPASLAVVPTPLIVEQPTNQVTYLYGSVTFQVTAHGAEPIHYQWQFQGTNIDGATNAILTFSPTSLRQAGAYSVLITNEFGTVTSSDALLKVTSLAAWGRAGEAFVPDEATNVVAIATLIGYNVALRKDGTVVTWGTTAPAVPSDLTNAIAVSAGQNFAVALLADRTVRAWGQPTSSSSTNVPAGLTNVVAIAAGLRESLALKEDGTLVRWGSGSTLASGLSNIVDITSWTSRRVALRQDGSIVDWSSGALVPDATNAVALDALERAAAITAEGLPVVWPSPFPAAPPHLTNLTAIGVGLSHVLALRGDGTLGAWGSNGDVTNGPPGLTNVVAIAVGAFHNLVLIDEDRAEFVPPEIRSVIYNESVRVSFPTRRGWRYRLEYKDALSDEHWTMLPPIPGDGTVQVASDPNPSPRGRFYRVRQVH
jgi:alpha-tubulin suppressor-like RCC1 family protein